MLWNSNKIYEVISKRLRTEFRLTIVQCNNPERHKDDSMKCNGNSEITRLTACRLSYHLRCYCHIVCALVFFFNYSQESFKCDFSCYSFRILRKWPNKAHSMPPIIILIIIECVILCQLSDHMQVWIVKYLLCKINILCNWNWTILFIAMEAKFVPYVSWHTMHTHTNR